MPAALSRSRYSIQSGCVLSSVAGTRLVTSFALSMTGTYFEDVPELQVLLDQAYKEIEEEQIQKLREEGDDAFALECFEKGKSPFDCGYRIDVFFPDEEFVPDDDRIEAWLKDSLASGDVELAEEIVLEHNGNYSGDLLGRSFELAEEAGCREFIDKNKKN